MDNIRITFMIKSASVNAFITLETERSEKISETVEHRERNNLQKVTSSMDGKKTSATAMIPTTPTLLRISEEYACIDRSPSLITPPITGTTELIANLTERKPIASALAATAVFIERIKKNTNSHTEKTVVRYFLIF